MSSKLRLDELILAMGLSDSRTKAGELVKSGRVAVNGIIVDRPGKRFDSQSDISIEGERLPVGRGYYKLKKAIDLFGIELEGKRVLDLGSSTGGFTQLLLERGASKVIAVDVGRGQLHSSLKSDSRVLSLEECDLRALTSDIIEGTVDFLTCDLSFISTSSVADRIRGFLSDNGSCVVLVKPQFEAGPGVARKGVVRSKSVHRSVIESLIASFERTGLYSANITFSPICGKNGNIEYLLFAKVVDVGFVPDITRIVEDAFAFFAQDVIDSP